jgi:DNA mismatch repair protein MutL
VHLFLEMSAEMVDVNVHPTKAEVRFREQSLVHEVVRRGLMDALGAGGVPTLQLRHETGAREPVSVAIPGMLGATYPSRWVPRDLPSPFSPELQERMRSATDMLAARMQQEASAADLARASEVPTQRPMIPLGQFRDTFIIAIDDEGIAIIDQHVAHERVLFERTLQQLTAGGLDAQRLLVPLVLDLSASAHDTLLGRSEALARLGYELEPFGDAAVKVSAVPALLGVEKSATALRALAEDLEGLDRGAQVEEALRRIAATTACHAAVKANDPLTYEKMRHILEELQATAYSTVCPHGRPVMLRLTRREIEKSFDRA